MTGRVVRFSRLVTGSDVAEWTDRYTGFDRDYRHQLVRLGEREVLYGSLTLDGEWVNVRVAEPERFGPLGDGRQWRAWVDRFLADGDGS